MSLQSVDSRQHVCEIDFLGVPWTFKYFYKLGYCPTLSTHTFFLLPSGKALAALLKFLIWLSHHLSVLNTWKRQWDCDLCLTQEQNNPTHQAHISVTSLVGSHTDLILLQASVCDSAPLSWRCFCVAVVGTGMGLGVDGNKLTEKWPLWERDGVLCNTVQSSLYL